MWNQLRLFTIREVFAHFPRTVLAATVMGVSAGLLVAVLGIGGSVTGSVDRLTKGIAGDAVLEVSGITDSGFDQEVHQQVSAVPGVRTAAPMVRTQINADGERALLIGADLSAAQLGSELAGSLRQHVMALGSGVVVGHAMGLAVDDLLTVGSRSIRVSAVLDEATSVRLNGGRIVIAVLGTAQELVGRPDRLDSIQIVADEGTDLEQLRSALTTAVGGRAVVADPALRSVQAGGAVQLVRYGTLMAAAAALVVSSFLIYNVMSMAVVQRRPMLSLLRALGGRRWPMVRGLLLESAGLGLVGALCGSAVGVVMGRLSIATLPPAVLQSVEARTEFLLPWFAIPVAVTACVAAATLAAAVAAAQVYRVAPIEALAPTAVAQEEFDRRGVRWVALAIGVAMAITAIVVAHIDIGRLSLGSITLSFAAALLLCYFLAGPLVRACAATARLFGAPGELGATGVQRAPKRVWATAMTVTIAVAATVAIGSASSNLVESASRSFDDLAEIDAFVSPAAMDSFPTGPVLPGELRERVAAVAGVERVTSGQMAFATLGRERIIIQALEPGTPNDALRELRPGVEERMASGTGVVISRDVARSLAVEQGAMLSLPTPTGIRQVEVLQVIPYFSAIGGMVLMDLDRLREWYLRAGETVINVFYEPTADPAAVTAELRRVVPPELHVERGEEAVSSIAAGVRQGVALSNAILWIVVLVSTVALLNTLMLSVLDRRRELGVLRAIGTSRRFMLRSVLAEATGIGVVGASIGLLVGAGTQYLATSAMSQAMTIDVAYRASPMLLVYAVIALALALIGSMPPAIKAARMPIVQALAAD
ncbi:FtsX-like permease family protein [Nocardia lijiangensis]|uniref:FtsX-like permease family protein n=1 Tax=Nocardia lijiangensis TaxID=299618 RepID=UPI003D74A3E5